MRLSPEALAPLDPGVERASYDRGNQAIGIVHFGIGAFHRAHQAWYTDLAMDAGDRGWAIAGVSLRSESVARQLNPQGGLYSVTEQSAEGSRARLVGAVREVLVASLDSQRVVTALASRQTRIVTFTVTEKGYCRANDGSLDLSLADGGSFYPLIERALRVRRDTGVAGFTLLSCDNLAQNGHNLESLLREYLAARAPDLTDWFDAECTCPNTMVDRIVPATTEADRNIIEQMIGLRDEAAIVTEPFNQWVIENRFVDDRPRWEDVGAQIVSDVEPYETAKLRLLNGSHSALAYLGLRHGHTYVHEAIADPDLRPIIKRLMCDEATTSFVAAEGQDLTRYAEALLARFSNPALNHKLIQIAMDGSQKIPQRWLETLAVHQREGRICPSILSAIGAWLQHIRGDNRQPYGLVDDPMATCLSTIVNRNDIETAIVELFGERGVLASAWRPTVKDIAIIRDGMQN